MVCKGCVVAGGMHGWGVCVGYDEIRSMSGQYASYWNAFLLSNTKMSIMPTLGVSKNL